MLTNSLLAAAHQGFFMPIEASKIAREIDPLAWYIHGVTIFFTVLICALTAWFAWKYRASVHPQADPPGHNNLLEVTWTVIPAFIIFVMFFWGFRVYTRMTTPSPAAVQIDAVGQMWNWSFQYRNPKGGKDIQSTDLYLPLNKPVQIQLRSNDVIHALFIPTMRVKKDVVPGRLNQIVVEATKATDPTNPFSLYCAEYCGDNHSRMLGKVYVLDEPAYAAKMDELANIYEKDGKPRPLVEVGKDLATLAGCVSCHSQDGRPGTGPTWKDMYGHEAQLADGTSVKVDENYIIESIRNPNAKVVKGFGPPSAMNAFSQNQLPDKDVMTLIEYMKSISSAGGGSPASASQPVEMNNGQRSPQETAGEKK